MCIRDRVEDQRQILGSNTLAVVLDFHLDEIAHVLHADINVALGLVNVFNGIADDIIDDTLDLLRVGDDLYVLIHIVKISQLDILFLQLQGKLLYAIRKVSIHINPVKGVRDPVRINLGIEGQLIDQPLHEMCIRDRSEPGKGTWTGSADCRGLDHQPAG